MKGIHVLALILLFALAFRMYFFIGFVERDSTAYVNGARQIAEGNLNLANVWLYYFRFMVILPALLFFSLFGYNSLASSMWPLICSLGNITLAYLIGRLLFNERAGLIAAFLHSFFPLDVIYSTTLMPDIPLAFFMGASAFFFFRAEKKSFPKGHLFLSGLLLGLAYYVRIVAIIQLVFYVAYLAYRREYSIKHVLLAAGFIAIILPSMIYFRLEYGSMFLREETARRNISLPAPNRNDLDLGLYARDMLSLDNNNRFDLTASRLGLFYYLTIPSIAYIIYFKKKNAYPALMWLAALFMILEFGTFDPLHPIPYRIMHHATRYLTIITLPAILVSAYALEKLMTKKRAPAVFAVLAVLLLASSLTIKPVVEYYRRSYDETAILIKLLEEYGGERVYLADFLLNKALFSSGYSGRYDAHRLWPETIGEVKNGSIVFLTVEEAKDNPPENWALIERVDVNESISFEITNDIRIYRVT